ncbi:hypothetical protein M8J76_009026 [Diaphorina citri]|nr:hypothetical protein M8J77_005545 [Diaphorina citri]KAI5709049.1 hypothetical protein M8J76_009026 [Diaphorina citri]
MHLSNPNLWLSSLGDDKSTPKKISLCTKQDYEKHTWHQIGAEDKNEGYREETCCKEGRKYSSRTKTQMGWTYDENTGQQMVKGDNRMDTKRQEKKQGKTEEKMEG